MNIIGTRFNFTWSCDAEPNGNWGNQYPISGPRNASGSWGGVFGLVVNGTYPLCISTWHMYEWRVVLLDFTSMGNGMKQVTAYYPSAPKYDLKAFVKPFSQNSWIAIAFVSIFLTLTVYLGLRFERIHQQNNENDAKLSGIHSRKKQKILK